MCSVIEADQLHFYKALAFQNQILDVIQRQQENMGR